MSLYFRWLKKFLQLPEVEFNSSKKRLIIKLTKSIEDKKEVKIRLKDLSGAWEDARDSDEIINEIRNSRVDKQDNIEL